MTNVQHEETPLHENPKPKKIRKINTESDAEEDEEPEDEDITDNTANTGISFFTNTANEQFLFHTLTDQKEMKKTYNNLCKKQVRILNQKSKQMQQGRRTLQELGKQYPKFLNAIIAFCWYKAKAN